MNIFKIQYYWYEGEHEEIFIGKDVDIDEFEKDLIKAKEFAKSIIGKEIEEGDYLGKGYSVECLPEFYNQIIWYLTEKLSYITCYFEKNIDYTIEDFPDKISVIKSEKEIKKDNL